MNSPLPASATQGFPLTAADQCVKCGMCLPHCPTYRASQHEGDSPRGRIMLMQGLATGLTPATETVQAHLDGCLTCRACEAVCPAEVPYGDLIDAVRQTLQRAEPGRNRLQRVMGLVLVNRALRFVVTLALWLYQRSGLQWLVRVSRILGAGKLARLESLLPRIYLPRLPDGAPASGQKVALFANCTSPLTEPQTLDAAVKLLSRLGCNVTVPEGQTCCGALHQHAGFAEQANTCASRNVRACASAEAVVGVASGCTAQLVEYGGMLGEAAGAAFARKSFDLHGFIARHPQKDLLRFKPLKARVLLHSPCTLRNVLKDAAHVRALLARVPELEVRPLESGCCGAAGSYFLTQPAMADRLLQPLLDQIAATKPDYVLSSNVGCSMHVSAGLTRAGIRTPVLHPARLLAEQLDG